MSRLDPTVNVMCDLCDEEESFRMTALANNCWDERGLEGQIKAAGWEEDGDRHTCPGCIEDREL